MLIVVSPAKRLDETPARTKGGTHPSLDVDAAILARRARDLTADDLQRLMHISAKLATTNVARFAGFGSDVGAKPAVGLFAGDTYAGLEAGTLEPEEMDWAQDHLRILSGLYGLLRPRDLIAPHRLEMGTRLDTDRGCNLYDFWGDRIAERLNADAAAVGAKVLVNCASVEYFTAANRPVLGLRVVTPVFMEDRAEGPKIVAFFAKKARGAMARFIIQRRLTDPAGLRDFDSGGYRYRADLSTADRPVFVRPAG
jgi:cytoplasmic iron level regulating protein YaaA (DUF328/UPF0246 family)